MSEHDGIRIGARFLKEFEEGVFEGLVEGYDRHTKLFDVFYPEDEDTEELDASELRPLIEDYAHIAAAKAEAERRSSILTGNDLDPPSVPVSSQKQASTTTGAPNPGPTPALLIETSNSLVGGTDEDFPLVLTEVSSENQPQPDKTIEPEQGMQTVNWQELARQQLLLASNDEMSRDDGHASAPADVSADIAVQDGFDAASHATEWSTIRWTSHGRIRFVRCKLGSGGQSWTTPVRAIAHCCVAYVVPSG